MKMFYQAHAGLFSIQAALIMTTCFYGVAELPNTETSSAGIFMVTNSSVPDAPVLPVAPPAAPVTSADCTYQINFDEQTVPCRFVETIRLTELYAWAGMHFSGPGGNDGGAILNECGMFGVTGHSSPNFLAFSSMSELSDGGTPIGPETITFDSPIVYFSALFGAGDGGTVTMTAYDAQGYQVDTSTQSITATLSPVRVMGRNISRVTFNCTSPQGWVVDDVCFIQEGGMGVLVLLGTCSASLDHITPALSNLGYTDVTVVTDSSEYEFAIKTGTWDLIIVDDYTNILDDGILDGLFDHLAEQRKIIFYNYAISAYSSHPFVNSMGIELFDSYDIPKPVYAWEPSPLFETPNTIPDLSAFSDFCGIDGNRVNPVSTNAVAGYTSSPAANEAAIVMNDPENFIVNFFTPGTVTQDSDMDSKNDMVELYENEIYHLAGLGDSLLTAAPASLGFYLPPDGTETQQVTLKNESTVPVHWTSGAAKVLYICADTPGNFLDELRYQPGIGTVDYLDARYTTPSLSQLQAYEVVLVLSNFAFLDSVALGDVLADYVDVGGKVINAGATLDAGGFGWQLNGRFVTDGYQALVQSSTDEYLNHELGSYEAGHPIMAGITNVTGYYAWGVTVPFASELIASWNNGTPLLATRGGQVASINVMVSGIYSVYGGDMARLFGNAVLWLRGESPLGITPPMGTLLPGETVSVDVTGDVSGMAMNTFKDFDIWFKGAKGGRAKVDVTLGVVFPCTEGAAFSQRPQMPGESVWLGFTSSSSSPHVCYDNFSALTEPVTAVRWWGASGDYYSGWDPCDRPAPDEFQIAFYYDNGGLPGTLAAEYTVQPTITATGEYGMGIYQVNEYETLLPAAVDIASGWISIKGLDTDDCWFLWVGSPEGDGRSLQYTTVTPSILYYDLSMCLATSPRGKEADVAPRPNGDGNIVASDWVQVGRFTAALNIAAEGSEFQRADCAPRGTSGGGSLTSADWVQAGRYAAALDTPLLQAGPTSPSKNAGEPILVKSAAGSSSLFVSGGVVPAGQEITLDITLDALGAENALGFSLGFDPRQLTFLSLEPGPDLPETALFLVNESQAGQGKAGALIGLELEQALPSGLNRVAVARFAAGDTAGAALVSFSGTPVPLSASTTDAREVGIVCSSGEVLIAESDTVETPVASEGDNPTPGAEEEVPAEPVVPDNPGDGNENTDGGAIDESDRSEGESVADGDSAAESESAGSNDLPTVPAAAQEQQQQERRCGGCFGGGAKSLQGLLADWLLVGLSLMCLIAVSRN